jgi:hypothetical protein
VANQTLSMPSANAEPASKAPPVKMIPLTLKRGYWAKPGTEYQDVKGETHTVTDTNDERLRKNEKLLPGYKVALPVPEAKKLLDGGKAELDAGY